MTPETDVAKIQLAGLGLRSFPGDYPVSGINPHKHQLGLYDALTRGEPGVFVNDAVTGAGKTVSWVAPVVEDGLHTVATYPTNALLADQYENITTLLDRMPNGDAVTVLSVTSDSLSDQGEYGEAFPDASSNGERLALVLNEAFESSGPVILLTNPDIFVLLRRQLYRQRITGINRFDVAVVDEFHRATRKEKNTLLFLLDEMFETDRSVCRLEHLVFLSATPDTELQDRFENAMAAPYYEASEFGWRADEPGVVASDEPVTVNFEPGGLPDGYRAVLPPVELAVSGSQTFETAATLLSDQETLVERVGQGRTVVMVDGIHEVGQLYSALREALPDTTVERIDGFNNSDKKSKLDSFDVLVSNSAVEVGVDFDTDQVMFSGHNAASFFQRLGRLRTREDVCRAYAYTPPYLVSEIEAIAEATDQDWMHRDTFESALTKQYVDESEPESFDWRFSAVEAFNHVENRLANMPSDKREAVGPRAHDRVSRHFFTDRGGLQAADVERIQSFSETGVAESLESYRSDSIQTLVYNETEDSVQAYSLPYLLRHGDVQFYERSSFFSEELPSELMETAERLERWTAGYCVYRGEYDPGPDAEYSSRLMTYTAEGGLYSLFDEPQRDREPRCVSGLGVETRPEIPGIGSLKDELCEEKILCYTVRGDVEDIQSKYSLGPFGFMYTLLCGVNEGVVVFGHNALYLYCRVQDALRDSSY